MKRHELFDVADPRPERTKALGLPPFVRKAETELKPLKITLRLTLKKDTVVHADELAAFLNRLWSQVYSERNLNPAEWTQFPNYPDIALSKDGENVLSYTYVKNMR